MEKIFVKSITTLSPPIEPEALRTEFDSLRRTSQLAWALTYSGNQPPFDRQIVDNTRQLRDALRLIENRFRISTLLGVFDALLQAWDTPNAGRLRVFVRIHLIGYEGRRTFVQKLRANRMWYCEQNGATQLARNLLQRLTGETVGCLVTP